MYTVTSVEHKTSAMFILTGVSVCGTCIIYSISFSMRLAILQYLNPSHDPPVVPDPQFGNHYPTQYYKVDQNNIISVSETDWG